MRRHVLSARLERLLLDDSVDVQKSYAVHEQQRGARKYAGSKRPEGVWPEIWQSLTPKQRSVLAAKRAAEKLLSGATAAAFDDSADDLSGVESSECELGVTQKASSSKCKPELVLQFGSLTLTIETSNPYLSELVEPCLSEDKTVKKLKIASEFVHAGKQIEHGSNDNRKRNNHSIDSTLVAQVPVSEDPVVDNDKHSNKKKGADCKSGEQEQNNSESRNISEQALHAI